MSRRVADWFLSRPFRLIAAVTVVLVLTIGFVGGTLTGGDHDKAQSASPQTSSPGPVQGDRGRRASSPPPAPSASPSGDSLPHARARAAARTRARDVAIAYLTAFLSDTGTDAQWRTQINRYTTATLRRLNATVPRAAVPDARLRGASVDAAGTYYASVLAELSDGTRLQVALVLEPHGWRVTAADPAPPSPDVNG